MAFKKSYVITTLKSLKRAIGHLYTVKRAIAAIEQKRNKAIIKTNDDADKELEPLVEEHDAILGAIWQFIMPRLPEIFSGMKEAKFPSAVIVKTPSSSTEVVDQALLVKAVRALGAGDIVHVDEKVPVAALNARPELVKQLLEKYPGTIVQHKYLNFKLNYRPRGRKDQLGSMLTPETRKEDVQDS